MNVKRNKKIKNENKTKIVVDTSQKKVGWLIPAMSHYPRNG